VGVAPPLPPPLPPPPPPPPQGDTPPGRLRAWSGVLTERILERCPPKTTKYRIRTIFAMFHTHKALSQSDDFRQFGHRNLSKPAHFSGFRTAGGKPACSCMLKKSRTSHFSGFRTAGWPSEIRPYRLCFPVCCLCFLLFGV
jgi:hypothetical protein